MAQPAARDTMALKYPLKDFRISRTDTGYHKFDLEPGTLKRTVEYDALRKCYVITEKIGSLNYRPPQYISVSDYLQAQGARQLRTGWKRSVDTLARKTEEERVIPRLVINSPSFIRAFGGNTIDIRPQGFAEVGFGMKYARNENPVFTERQRSQLSLDFRQRMQVNVDGRIGSRLQVLSNYNTDAQFDFENQVKINYKGGDDDVLQALEAGNVSMPLNSTLIKGTQALFGIKTQLKFGNLRVTSVASQQRSQYKEITISNGARQNEFRITADNYDANRHFFLAHFFRDQYNEALRDLPLIRSMVNVTQIEVWVTNRSNANTHSRDVLALMDLGESKPYDVRQTLTGASVMPAAGPVNDPAFPQQSNSLLLNLFSYSPEIRNTNAEAIVQYFRSNGGINNYSKLVYARRLNSTEFTLNARLGYISLLAPLNADEVLSVAYRYNYNGKEYQVGEFSTDVNINVENPGMLITKLLKNEVLDTSLPSWDLMMKNIYTLGASGIGRNNFTFNIFRLDEQTGVEVPALNEGALTTGRRWLDLLGLDRLDQAGRSGADGIFDLVPGVTIDQTYGRVIFSRTEPFGKDLAALFAPGEEALRKKYVFDELYRLTPVDARLYHSRLNRFVLKGTYLTESGSEFMLNASNIPVGSVSVLSGAMPLTEGRDFMVDYQSGRLKILDPAFVNSDQPLKIRLESNELFGLQQRSLFGTHLDYQVDDRFNIGATVMSLSEKPLTAKVNAGQEPVSNTIWGLNANYTVASPWITRLLNKLPFVNTREPSTLSLSAEYAKLIPGHAKALDFAGSKGVSYIDDFEATRSVIDLKGALGWQLSGTPLTVNRLFPEAELSNNLEYGYNRARLAFYNIDPLFYNRSGLQNAGAVRMSKEQLSDHYVREVLEQEVFPLKQSLAGQPVFLSTLDLAFYPTIRGPYNYSTQSVNSDGTLAQPVRRWGGIYRKIDAPDFEAQNVAYIEFWMMDPFIYKKNSRGGDLYFNLGNVSEDVLKDGRKSLENGLAPDGSEEGTDRTVWGRVPRLQPVIQSFNNDPEARKNQDIGLDGLNDALENQHFNTFVSAAKSMLSPEAAQVVVNDPSSDNFRYFRGGELERGNPGILRRYEKFNGPEGNSRTPAQSRQDLGIDNGASTLLPDGEDVNRDNNMSVTDAFFEYKVSVKPGDLVVGQNFVTDKVVSPVKLANGNTQEVTWYQFRIPIGAYEGKVGNIDNFKSVRFIRMFMTNFADTAVLRMGQLQLVRGDWRIFNAGNTAQDVLVDAGAATQAPDNSVIETGTVNIDENGKRSPIPYVLPPGIQRELDQANVNTSVPLNEQSLALTVRDLRDGYARAAFKTGFNDFRSYKNLDMFIHAEGERLRDHDLSAIVRLGSDNNDNYYEYEIPLKVTLPGSADPYQVWPEANNMQLQLSRLQDAKLARNAAGWPENIPFIFMDGSRKIYVKGQPDLSKVRVYMLGVRNPMKGTAGNTNADDGLDKSAQVWFNELRLTGFDERGGWAATASVNARLADLGDISVSGTRVTAGFGSIDQTVSERSRSDDRFFSLQTGLELGRLLGNAGRMMIPFYFNYSTQRSTPLFDPRNPDMELSRMLSGLSRAQRDSVHRIVDDITRRRDFSFNNIRKLRQNQDATPLLWDLENFSLSYAFSEYAHSDYINERISQKTYRGNINYTFMGKPKVLSPFSRLIKSDALALFRDLNINLVPSLISVRMELDRVYGENTLRREISADDRYRTTFNKNFRMTRLYGLNWNLTRSLQVDFNAGNYSVIDEPKGKAGGLSNDSLWHSLTRLGRTTDYDHRLNINYNTPLNKVPGLRWTSLVMRYGVTFRWQSQPLSLMGTRNPDIGNSIQNTRTVQMNPNLNFASLYARWKIDPGTANVGLRFLTMLRNVSGVYASTMGIYLPGYRPRTNVLGMDFRANAPGLGFLLGSQKDIRVRAVQRGWLTTDSLQNAPYLTTDRRDLNLRAILEPFAALRIELTAMRSKSTNFSSNFRLNPLSGKFEDMSPVTTGDLSMSWFSLPTSFSGADGQELFKRFEKYRSGISQRLGVANANSSGLNNGFAEGYGKNAQEVLVGSFVAAYTGVAPEKVSLNAFPRVPIPNWRVNYNGNINRGWLSEVFSSINFNHAYASSYTISGFNSLVRYRENSGASSVKDASGNFLPGFQFSELILLEQFLPFVGVDLRMRNNLNVNMEYRRSRAVSLSLANSQIAHQTDNGWMVGLAFRSPNMRLPFNWLSDRRITNDMSFKFDLTMDDRRSTIFRPDVQAAEVSDGARIWGIRPSVDCLLNQKVNLRLFYESNINNPYTSQAFMSSFSNFGINLRYIL